MHATWTEIVPYVAVGLYILIATVRQERFARAQAERWRRWEQGDESHVSKATLQRLRGGR